VLYTLSLAQRNSVWRLAFNNNIMSIIIFESAIIDVIIAIVVVTWNRGAVIIAGNRWLLRIT